MISSPRLRCMIVDDELVARDLIQKYVSKTPYLDLVAVCSTATEALFQIRDLQPELIFLDIEMPGITGFELLKLLPAARPAVIMITADPSYALEGYEQQVTDYLMKPVSFDRFSKAVNKALQNRPVPAAQPVEAPKELQPAEHAPEESLNALKPQSDFLLLKENKKLIRVRPEEIHFIEGMKDYLKLYWSDRVSIIHMKMSTIEDILSKHLFLRVNRSYIINKDAIHEIEGNEITTRNGKKVPIGVTYRADVMNALLNNKLWK
ncbi:LytR/AlgR family response regulator transcription factor [Dyadobacter crusticola]|uniref:LytR/AlgR family response regulator transcription factor n=1 Tax=Dyadobacter crusticola TaxID=292407 RepID=UPI0004E1C5C8|nr:response regulator [Dyadobacter crusticola]